MSETHVSRGNSPIVRVAIASWIGTSIEWWDFILYGTAAALVLGPLFFSPKLSPLAAQLSAFATFWVGFAARPVGGIVFCHFGDRLGRKKMLPNDRFSGFWLEDTLPAQYCASRCRFIYPAEDCRNA